MVLDGARTVRIKAVDTKGIPLTDVKFSPWGIFKAGRRRDVNFPRPIFTATTGPDGIATFDWLPPATGRLQFWPQSPRYSRRLVIVEEDELGTVTTTLSRTETIRGRVARADGVPAAGIQVQAESAGPGEWSGGGRHYYAQTAADGSYEMTVGSNEAFAVFVNDPSSVASARLDVVVREGQPVSGVDFTLSRGTVVRGTVTVGPDNRPAPNQIIRLIEKGEVPNELRQPGDKFRRVTDREVSATTDADGSYSMRVGPGTYTLLGPPRTEKETISLRDESELVRDFRMPRPEKGPISGRVTHAGKGVAGATVEIIAVSQRGGWINLKADDGGQFQGERVLDKSCLLAKSPDGSLGAIVVIGPLDPEVVIEVAPTATASGLLLDATGRPVANRLLYWGRQIPSDEDKGPWRMAFGSNGANVKTDAAGRFTMPELVVRQEYFLSFAREGTRDFPYNQAGVVRPEQAGPIDVGTLRAH